MAHLLKLNAGNLRILQHYERNLQDGVQERKNLEIDAKRTSQNYDLITGQTGETAKIGDLKKRLEARLAELKIQKRRANTVLAATWVVTLPAELKEAPQEKQREFFQHTVQFMKNRYGEENLIGAWVHNDETTPHIHMTFTPEERVRQYEIVNGEKKDVTDYNNFQGTGKLHAYSTINRTELPMFQRDLQRYLEREMGMQLSILNGATKARGKNATTDELKGETARLEQVKGMVNGIYNAMPTTAAAVEVFQAAADFFKAHAEYEEGLVSEKEGEERQAEARERLQAALEGRGMGFDSPALG